MTEMINIMTINITDSSNLIPGNIKTFEEAFTHSFIQAWIHSAIDAGSNAFNH
jgi:hypothetical protein